MLEVEVKVRASISETEEKLAKAGFERGTTVYEKDVYYNGDFKDLKSEDKALRIREYKDMITGEARYVLNFKGPKIDNSTMSRTETEFEIPSFAHGEALFNGLGFYEAGRVEKIRVYYDRDEIECCLDRVTGLGEFLEIEIMAEDDGYEGAMAAIEELMMRLGISMDESITTSYLSMLQKM